MTRTAILTLALYCGFEFLGVFIGTLTVAMTATENATLPNWTSLTFAALVALAAPVKTIMPILKALLTDAGLRMNGDASPVAKATAKIL